MELNTYVRTYVVRQIGSGSQSYTLTHQRVRLLKYARAHTNIYVHTQARTYVRTYGTHVHTYVPIRINVRCVENVAQYLRAYVRTYVCIRTRICVQ